MSYGNSTSTVRHFKRVPSNHQVPSPPQDSPQDSVFDSDAENRPPKPQEPAGAAAAAVPATKEAVLGRRAFAKSIDPAFQEAYSATGDRTKREILARVAETWSKLDELDPEGELLLLRGIMDRIQADPKLSSVLLPQRVANAQLASLRANSPSKKSSSSSSTTSTMMTMGSEVVGGTGSRDVTPQASPTRSRLHPADLPSSPSKTEQGSPGKLVLNPQNPHLRKMRSNQQLKAEQEKAAIDEKMGGKAEPGLEHVGVLSDVLYGRWTEGLRVRWPIS
jgi:serine/threonine-protein kinase 24/25/MST4